MNFVVRTPTEDMWNLCQQQMRNAGYKWFTSGDKYVEYRNDRYIGFKNNQSEKRCICRFENPGPIYKVFDYDQFEEWIDNHNKLKLNDEYDAVLDRDKGVIKVGCQEITFDKVEELYKLIYN